MLLSFLPTITYTYDPAGRRIKKNVVGSYIVKYVYDGGQVIAEYDDSTLLRKYIYGARVDEPVCMLENPASDGIDVADNNATYYYHFDGLGSVVALSNSNGDSCQSYEYSAYGQVAASDPNFLANPYMFTGRRFDIETGLYYYRARYYNPHIGRFMQTDPVGYGYAYCGNNPLSYTDPSGLFSINIPTECLEDYSTGYAFTDVNAFFADFDFWKHYPQWKLASVELNGNVYNVTIDYIGDACDVCDLGLSVVNLNVYRNDGSRADTVPIVFLNGVYWLTNSALDRIIKPAIQEVNPWAWYAPGGISIYRLTSQWDSILRDNPDKWLYQGQVYSGSNVNYIVGGHAMANLKVGWYSAKAYFYSWKSLRPVLTWPPKFPRSPWSDALDDPFYWFKKGYDEYNTRKDW